MEKSTMMKLNDWSLHVRGGIERVQAIKAVRMLREDVSHLPVGGKLDLSTRQPRFYIFGQPTSNYAGGWCGTEDIRSIKLIDQHTLEVETKSGIVLVSLENYERPYKP